MKRENWFEEELRREPYLAAGRRSSRNFRKRGDVRLQRTESGTLGRFPEKIEEIAIGDSVTGIGDYAFAECDNIGKAVIGNAVTDIGGHAFANCDNLEAVTMPENLQHLGEGAFEYCEKLSSINGIKKLAVILEKWKAAGANAATFFRTALFESYVKEVESAGSSLSVVDSTGRTIAVIFPETGK